MNDNKRTRKTEKLFSGPHKCDDPDCKLLGVSFKTKRLLNVHKHLAHGK